MSAARDIYLQPVLKVAPRLLSRIDSEPHSRTYGCFDRTYWSWKFSDFPATRFQEGIYALAWLYTNEDAGRYARHHRLLDLIGAGLFRWGSLQHRDGSFDEAYPHEHSFAATAFTAFYIGEAVDRLGDVLDAQSRQSALDSLGRACDWLCANDETHGILSNHLAAGAAALTATGQLSNTDRYLERATFYLERIYRHQSDNDGWYEEYGGADPGYQTHGSFYLARIWERTRDCALLDSLRRSVNFLTHFVHPDGSLGGEYASRNTTFYFPAAFEMLAGEIDAASAIAHFMRRSVSEDRAAGLAAMDAWNLCPMLNNYLFAADAAKPVAGSTPLPHEGEGSWSFPDAGLQVRSTRDYYLVVGAAKGGVVKLFDKRRQVLDYSDCGYWAQLNGNRIVSSQGGAGWELTQPEPNILAVRVPFTEVRQKRMTPLLFIGFRLVTLTIGRIPWCARAVKAMLVRVLIKKRRGVRLTLERRINCGEAFVTISDAIT